MKRQDREPRAFIEDDQGIWFQHEDAIVVSLNIENYDVHHILIDNRISTNILYFDARKDELPTSQIYQICNFGGRSITLPVKMG